MADDVAGPAAGRGLRTARLEAFSDGVFAIAITLLVLDLAVPAGSEDDLLRAVVDQWPSFVAYLVSFATIGAIWLEHTLITQCLERADGTLTRLNLLLLLVVALLPFPTRLVSEYAQEAAQRVAVTIYGVTLFLASLVVSLLWRYAVREGLVRQTLADDDIRMLNRRLAPGLVAYAVVIAIGLVWPGVAVLGYLVVSVAILVPVGALRRRSPPRRARRALRGSSGR